MATARETNLETDESLGLSLPSSFREEEMEICGGGEDNPCEPKYPLCVGGERLRHQTRKRWFWLIAPDGSPSMADTSTRIATNEGTAPKKRKISEASADTIDRTSRMDPSVTKKNKNGSGWKKYLQHCEEKWNEKYQQLVEYKNKHGTTRVRMSNPILGKWVSKQRVSFWKDEMPSNRNELLNSIKFEWKTSREDAWIKMYNQLLSHKSQHDGSVHVPMKHKSLGKWVSKQRENYSKGIIPKQQVDLLESIGFKWQVVDPNNWMITYKRLVEYKKKNNHTRIPTSFKEDPQLGKWVSKERKMMDQNNWMITYKRLVEYKKKNNHTRVPINFKEDPKLGKWVHRQRAKCMKEDRTDLLNKIGFQWDLNGDLWMSMYHRLVAHKKKYGVASASRKDGNQLAKWVQRQRGHCKDEYRIELLNDIGFVWNTKRT